MAKHDAEPALYYDVPPIVKPVYRGRGFAPETGHLAVDLGAAYTTHFFNINELIARYSRGDRLSSEAFRPENDGYAFASGGLRFYGLYSVALKSTFVLSHSLLKKWWKLKKMDKKAMTNCIRDFDSWAKERGLS